MKFEKNNEICENNEAGKQQELEHGGKWTDDQKYETIWREQWWRKRKYIQIKKKHTK